VIRKRRKPVTLPVQAQCAILAVWGVLAFAFLNAASAATLGTKAAVSFLRPMAGKPNGSQSYRRAWRVGLGMIGAWIDLNTQSVNRISVLRDTRQPNPSHAVTKNG
jgi:hypothetical protein